MECRDVSHRAVLGWGILFWLCGALSCGFMGAQSLMLLAPAASDKPGRADLYAWLAFGLGACATLYYIPCVFLPLARAEVSRIKALIHPRPWHFFHPWRLLALCILIPTFSVIGHTTSQYFVSCMVFGGTVVPVSVGLWCGVFVLSRELTCNAAEWRGGAIEADEQLLQAGDEGYDRTEAP